MSAAAAQSVKEVNLAKCWELVRATSDKDPQGMPSKAWTTIPLATRTVLVMLASTSSADPRQIARQPWQSLPEEERVLIGTTARQIARDLKNASCLI